MDNPWATPWDPPAWQTSTELDTEQDIATHDIQTAPTDDWGAAWTTSSLPEVETHTPDKWEVARQEKERPNRAVPPGSLDSMLRRCQQVSQEIWPVSGTSSEDNWKSGFQGLSDIAALLALLLPADSALPPTAQFSETATAKAMNEALKLTRHLPASSTSPLSRLLASKGSLEWETSVKARQDVVLDASHAGWRVLEKDGRISTADDSKSRKVTGGLLSFWNRRVSATQATPVETPGERPSLESTKPVSRPPSSPPPKTSTPSVLPPPHPDSSSTVVATATAPWAVSRFLNRFSRVRSGQNGALALSSDDIEFLSDIVPSASDSHGEDTDVLDTLRGASNPSPIPHRLPPPIPPPLKQPTLSTHLSSAFVGLGTLDGASTVGDVLAISQVQIPNRAPNVPVLPPPPSTQSIVSFPRSQDFHLYPKDTVTPGVGQLTTPLTQQRQQPSSQANPRSRSSLIRPPLQKAPSSLSIPPLLPPPPVSPPQTPRPGAFASSMISNHPSMIQNTDTSFHDSHGSDDEFSAFASFPPSTPAPFPSSNSRRSPSPPSPPPRRAYERTHYPSTSSTSSIFSPVSRTSGDQLCSAKSSNSVSLDSFEDFVPSSTAVTGGDNRKRTPSPPPLPVKPQFRHSNPLYTNTSAPSPYHSHTSSQTFTSPTASLINHAFPISPVSDAEHQRTQSLVNHAAARGGLLWPNSPELDEPKVTAIPPPPSSSTSPKSLIGQGDFSLLDDIEPLNSGGLDSTLSSVVTIPFGGPFGDAGSSGKGHDAESQFQPSPPPLPSAPAFSYSFSSLAGSAPSTTTNTGSAAQSTKPKQIGGLSAQDLSFFEGL